jgi:hypothetical protein
MAAELSIKIKGDVSDFERKIGTVRDTAQGATRALKTMFESVGQYASGASRYAEGLASRLKFVREEAGRTEAAIRRLNIENRGGGATRSAGGGITGALREGTSGYASGFVGGSAAGAVTAGIGLGVDFVKSSVSTYVDAARANSFFESSVERTNLTLASQRGELEKLRHEFNLTGAEAARTYGQALRVAEGLGRPQDAARLVRSATAAAIAAGQSPGSAANIIRAIQSGEDEQLNRIGLPNPGQIYAEYARRQGRSAASLSAVEQQRAIEERVFGEGDRAGPAVARYRSGAAGRADFGNALFSDIQASVGQTFAGAAGDPLSLLLGPAAIPFAGARGAYEKVFGTGAAPAGGLGFDPTNITTAIQVGLVGAVDALRAGMAAISADITRKGDLVRPYENRLALLQARDPLSAIDVRYQQQSEDINRRYANEDPTTRARLFVANAAARQVEYNNTRDAISEQLSSRLGGLQSRNAARDNPVAAAMIAARTELAAFQRDAEKLGPTFAAQGQQIKTALVEGQRQGYVALAEGAFGQVANLQTRYASFQSRTRSTGYKTGFYGQQTDELTYGTTYGETPAERAARTFAEAGAFARELGGTGEDVARYAREFRLSGTSGISPGDLTDDERRQLQDDTLQEIREQTKQAREAVDLARNSEGYLQRIAAAVDPGPEKNPKQEATFAVINLAPGFKATLGTPSGGTSPGGLGGAFGQAIGDDFFGG